MPILTRNGKSDMVNVPPYAPSFDWYGCWYGFRMAGLSDNEAIAEANRICKISGKVFARTYVGNAEAPLVLSVAVDGGASRLKRKGTEEWVKLSFHGNWPHTHLGGLEALYGRCPYYQHIIPGFREVYANLPASLKDFNLAVHRWLTSFLQTDFRATKVDLDMMDKVMRRGEEIAAMLSGELSAIDALMRFGPEINLALLSSHRCALLS
ncbi:MAG: WbqC family protein [Muribaculaceae bacterium]|nr:WbqC family protein [Muribaculaceae bacterium]